MLKLLKLVLKKPDDDIKIKAGIEKSPATKLMETKLSAATRELVDGWPKVYSK